jgi:diguanylate cyclase (GGDEF)-like protein
MSQRLTVRGYAAGIFAAGCLVLVALAPTFSFGYVSSHPAPFVLLTAGVLLSELLPLQIPRRGNDEQITLSTSFSFALLLTAGVWPALITQAVASVIQDVVSGKPWWRVRFNVGQYTLSMAAAYGVLRALSGAPHVGSSRPFTAAELPVVVLAAAVFFAVNTSVVGTAVARYQEVPIGRYFRNDALFTAVTGAVLLCLAPIVVATTVYATPLIPLLMAPIVAIYRAGRLAARTEHGAHHDELTGLPNRAAFHQAVDGAIEDDCGSSCVLLMDLNRFKEVNDTLGHRYGDMLLVRIAERLKRQLREDDEVARLGGDEFAVFRRNVGAQTALKLGKSVAESLRASFELDEFVVDAEASVGISLFPDDGNDGETLLQKADVAMYRAKDTHTSLALYDESHDHHSPAKLALTADLRSAIDSGQIDVWFQPLLDLRTDRVPAVEALVRWQHPALGLLLPAAFLNMAEHTSLIKPLTQRVLELALGQVAGWQAGGIDVAVAVNVSTRVLVDSDFSDRVAAALEHARVPPDRLKLEVTESALMADPVVTRSILQRLTQLGVEISIDDFGTGYSSLAYLVDLPVSEVKIDRSFVTRMTTGSREEVIVRSTVDLGHHLGLRVVAEGAEERRTLQKLRTLGCDLVQGYSVSQAMATHDATRWLRKAQRRPRRLAPTAGEAA